MKNIQIIIVALITLIGFSSPIKAGAEEIVISGNGSDASSEVNISSSQNTDVQQSNNATVSNDVAVSSGTGDNSASGTTNGDTSITTGDIAQDVAVENTMNTSSVTNGGCCSQPGGGTISNIGTDSQNTITSNITQQTNVQISQNVSIFNTISGVAVTGNNQANDNSGGNVTIQTGNILVNEQIKNGPINVTKTDITTGTSGLFSFLIKGNGSGSNNTIHSTVQNDTDVTIDNRATVINNSIWNLITGNNDADDNTDGDVVIKTGDISLTVLLENGPINVNEVTVTNCCEEQKPPEEKPPVKEPPHEQPPAVGGPQPTNPTKNDDNKPGSGSDGKGGEVLGIALEKILPSTGSMLLYILLGNIIMLFFGVILRLRSGNAPGLPAFAI